MRFFDSLKKKPLKVDDQQLLLEAMLCVAFADGDDQFEETQLVRAFAATLPEFKNADAYEVYEKAEKSMKSYGALNRVKELSNLTSDALKQKAFLLERRDRRWRRGGCSARWQRRSTSRVRPRSASPAC